MSELYFISNLPSFELDNVLYEDQQHLEGHNLFFFRLDNVKTFFWFERLNLEPIFKLF